MSAPKPWNSSATRSSMVPKGLLGVRPPSRRQGFAVNACLALSKSADDFESNIRMINSSGETVWGTTSSDASVGMEAVELRGFMIHISERKRAEEALRESEERVTGCKHDRARSRVWDATRDETWTTPEGRRLSGGGIRPVNLERFVRPCIRTTANRRARRCFSRCKTAATMSPNIVWC